MTEELLSRDEQLTRALEIEHDTGIYVPRFLLDLPPVSREFAILVADQRQLPEVEGIKKRYRFRGGPPQDVLDRVKASAGLRYIRKHKLRSELDLIQAPEPENNSVLALFEKFKQVDRKKQDLLADQETKRRQKRDEDILNMELAQLKRRSIIAPQVKTLMEYCAWIPEGTGLHEKYRDWGRKPESFQTAEQIYWDLMGFYHQIMEKAQTSFDPLQDWADYIAGKLDLTSLDSWNLQNMGQEDISYYAMSDRWGGGARTTCSRGSYPGRLLTHSTSLGSANMIVHEGYLDPRICYSADRVVSSRDDSVVFIFDRQRMKDVYSVEPFSEPGGWHENEIRSNELNHIWFCIGCVPVSDILFPDFQGSGHGTDARGESVITRWSKRYEETGRLWSPEEEDRIREVCRSI